VSAERQGSLTRQIEPAALAESRVQKRSVRIDGHQTSITVEEDFWQGLKDIARKRELPLSNLLTDIHKQRAHPNLSSAIRLFVLEHYRGLADEAGQGKSKR
jgi:predicted DNA-binding ribbon-helix-helix protein